MEKLTMRELSNRGRYEGKAIMLIADDEKCAESYDNIIRASNASDFISKVKSDIEKGRFSCVFYIDVNSMVSTTFRLIISLLPKEVAIPYVEFELVSDTQTTTYTDKKTASNKDFSNIFSPKNFGLKEVGEMINDLKSGSNLKDIAHTSKGKLFKVIDCIDKVLNDEDVEQTKSEQAVTRDVDKKPEHQENQTPLQNKEVLKPGEQEVTATINLSTKSVESPKWVKIPSTVSSYVLSEILAYCKPIIEVEKFGIQTKYYVFRGRIHKVTTDVIKQITEIQYIKTAEGYDLDVIQSLLIKYFDENNACDIVKGINQEKYDKPLFEYTNLSDYLEGSSLPEGVDFICQLLRPYGYVNYFYKDNILYRQLMENDRVIYTQAVMSNIDMLYIPDILIDLDNAVSYEYTQSQFTEVYLSKSKISSDMVNIQKTIIIRGHKFNLMEELPSALDSDSILLWTTNTPDMPTSKFYLYKGSQLLLETKVRCKTAHYISDKLTIDNLPEILDICYSTYEGANARRAVEYKLKNLVPDSLIVKDIKAGKFKGEYFDTLLVDKNDPVADNIVNGRVLYQGDTKCYSVLNIVIYENHLYVVLYTSDWNVTSVARVIIPECLKPAILEMCRFLDIDNVTSARIYNYTNQLSIKIDQQSLGTNIVLFANQVGNADNITVSKDITIISEPNFKISLYKLALREATVLISPYYNNYIENDLTKAGIKYSYVVETAEDAEQVLYRLNRL